MADITVTSRDLERVRRLHKRFPALIEKTFPATAREETKEFKRDIKQRIIRAGWSRSFRFTKDQKTPIDLAALITPKFKGYKELGISIKPKSMGAAVLFEMGSKGERRRKPGGLRRKPGGGFRSTGLGSTGKMPANPVFGPEWLSFRMSGKNDIQRSFLKSTDRVLTREMRKMGIRAA